MGRFVQATDALMDYLSRVGAREAPFVAVGGAEDTDDVNVGG